MRRFSLILPLVLLSGSVLAQVPAPAPVPVPKSIGAVAATPSIPLATSPAAVVPSMVSATPAAVGPISATGLPGVSQTSVKEPAAASSAGAKAQPDPEVEPRHDWSFQGVRAKWDKDEIYRGYMVATQVCMACHSFKYISHADLMKVGFSEAEVKKLASDMHMGINDKLISALKPEDALGSYGKVPPDLSLMVKAREEGADYVYALLHCFSEDPKVIHAYLPDGLAPNAHFNRYFPGHNIAMPEPITGPDMVTYADGTKATKDQEIHDVVTFLQWTAEPERMERQHLGVYVLIYLLIFVILAGLTKKALWKDIEH